MMGKLGWKDWLTVGLIVTALLALLVGVLASINAVLP
jgi:tetrahydromethanopterin S-methyltransferase subunit B